MEIAYLFATSQIIRDENTKKFTYVDVFQTFMMPRDVESWPQFFSVAGRILGVEAGHADVRVKIVRENDTVLAETTLSGDVKAGDLDIAARFDLVMIDSPGKYYLKVDLNGVPLQDNNRFYITVQRQA